MRAPLPDRVPAQRADLPSAASRLLSQDPVGGLRIEAQDGEVADRAFQTRRRGAGLATEDQASKRAVGFRVAPARVLFAVQARTRGFLAIDDVLAAHVPAVVVVPALIPARDPGAR